ncbi:Uncharacterised protein [Anaerobiospirillum thomasii]|nr:Uncharacterised protein [Anaerobiospirillum thomasii]
MCMFHIMDIFAGKINDIISEHMLHQDARLTYSIDSQEFYLELKANTKIQDVIDSTVKQNKLEMFEFELFTERPYSLRIHKLKFDDEAIIMGHHCFTNGFFKIELTISKEDFIAIEGKIRDAIYKFVLEQMNYHEGAKVDYE